MHGGEDSDGRHSSGTDLDDDAWEVRQHRMRDIADEADRSRTDQKPPEERALFVETLLERGRDRDLADAEAAVDQLAVVSAHHAWVISGVWLLRLRALLAQAHGDETAYRDYRDRYRAMATEHGFEGHMAIAEAMA